MKQTILAALMGIMVISGIALAFDPNDAWHPLSQIVKSSTNLVSVDANNDGVVDSAQSLATGATGSDLTLSGSIMANAFYYSSDISLKTEIKPISNALERVLQLTGITFIWKADESKKQNIGFIAQDVEKAFPEAVSTDSAGLKSVQYGNLVAPIIEAIKEQQANYLGQENEIQQLKWQVSQLRAELKEIKSGCK
jgi:hypothetical protein